VKLAITIFRDLAGVAGAGVLDYGIFQIYSPAGYIAGGAILLAATLLMALKESN
jgi:hypothetical protein